MCDVDRLTDLEITKKEVLIEKEKMKYGALTGRRKDPGVKKYTPLSRPTLSDREDQASVTSRYEEERSDLTFFTDEKRSVVEDNVINDGHHNESHGKLDDNTSKPMSAAAISLPAVAEVVNAVLNSDQSTTSSMVSVSDVTASASATSPHHTQTSPPSLSSPLPSSPSSSQSTSSLLSSQSPPPPPHAPPPTHPPQSPSSSSSSSSSVSARESLARSVSSMLYSLSLLGVTHSNLPPEGTESLWRGLRSFSKGTNSNIILFNVFSF